jgi:hypothetical protein
MINPAASFLKCPRAARLLGLRADFFFGQTTIYL